MTQFPPDKGGCTRRKCLINSKVYHSRLTLSFIKNSEKARDKPYLSTIAVDKGTSSECSDVAARMAVPVFDDVLMPLEHP